MSDSTNGVGDMEQLLLGAGFAFGVMLTLLVLEVVLVASGSIAVGELFTTSETLVVLAGIVFSGIVGIALYVLSFPENRETIPIAADDE